MLAARLALVALGLATAVPLRLHKAILPEDGPSSNSSLNSTMNCTWNSTSIDCTMTNSSKPEVHLALIVLTKDGFNNGEEWMRWVDEAKRDGLTPRLYVHAYNLRNESARSRFSPPELRRYLVNETLDTAWCGWGLVQVEMMLARHALLDPAVTHVATASDSHVPVSSLKEMHDSLRADPQGRFCGESVDTPSGWNVQQMKPKVVPSKAAKVEEVAKVAKAEKEDVYEEEAEKAEGWWMGEEEEDEANGDVAPAATITLSSSSSSSASDEPGEGPARHHNWTVNYAEMWWVQPRADVEWGLTHAKQARALSAKTIKATKRGCQVCCPATAQRTACLPPALSHIQMRLRRQSLLPPPAHLSILSRLLYRP